ncbi:MAG: ABC transporter ATP-binding protein [Patescibacteria group bacterium]|nr:ABC transporter ATP-binding protein [Patescibacteria group bacterium]
MFPQRKFFKPYWRHERGTIAVIVVAMVLSQLFALLEPYLWTRLLDGFLRQAGNTLKFPTELIFISQVTSIIVLWIVAAFCARIFKNLQQYYATTVADRVGIRVFLHAFTHILDLPMQFHANVKGGEIFRKLTKARTDITTLLTTYFQKVLQNLFVVTLVVGYTVILNWRIGLLLLVYTPLFLLVTVVITNRIRHLQNKINRANEELFGTAVEAITHVEVVKAYATTAHEHRQAARDHRIAHRYIQQRTRAHQWLTFAQGTIINLARVSTIWYSALLLFRGQLSFGDLVLFNIFTFWLYEPLTELGEIYAQYQEGSSAVERLQSVLHESCQKNRRRNPVVPDRFSGAIEFRHVSFTYVDEHREVLRDVSFKVKPGQKLGLVGMSGSGKSTIVKLLLRFYEPSDGEILIDGRDIRDYDLEALRECIGLVMQDNILFNLSLADNIRYGTFDASDEAVVAAAQRAYLDDLVAKLPDGYRTMIGERGIKLSGGERQRVAIARAIIKQPNIIIFDEATSALDSHSEELIQRAIREISRGITTITVAHHFTSMMDADTILLFEDGRIQERGTHRELLRKRGRYRELYELQTQRGELEEPPAPAPPVTAATFSDGKIAPPAPPSKRRRAPAEA